MRISWALTTDGEQRQVTRRLFRQARASIGRADRHHREGRNPRLVGRALRQAVTFLAACHRLGWESPEDEADLCKVAARAGITVEGT